MGQFRAWRTKISRTSQNLKIRKTPNLQIPPPPLSFKMKILVKEINPRLFHNLHPCLQVTFRDCCSLWRPWDPLKSKTPLKISLCLMVWFRIKFLWLDLMVDQTAQIWNKMVKVQFPSSFWAILSRIRKESLLDYLCPSEEARVQIPSIV